MLFELEEYLNENTLQANLKLDSLVDYFQKILIGFKRIFYEMYKTTDSTKLELVNF